MSQAACQVSNTVNSVEMELDAAKGFLDRAAAESLGQTNATFTNVNVSLPVWGMLYQIPDLSCLIYDVCYQIYFVSASPGIQQLWFSMIVFFFYVFISLARFLTCSLCACFHPPAA